MRTKESVAELARPTTAANARYNIERGARPALESALRVRASASRISDEVGELLAVGGLLLLAAVLAPILGV